MLLAVYLNPECVLQKFPWSVIVDWKHCQSHNQDATSTKPKDSCKKSKIETIIRINRFIDSRNEGDEGALTEGPFIQYEERVILSKSHMWPAGKCLIN